MTDKLSFSFNSTLRSVRSGIDSRMGKRYYAWKMTVPAQDVAEMSRRLGGADMKGRRVYVTVEVEL